MQRLDVRLIRDEMFKSVRDGVSSFKAEHGFPPRLDMILVGDDRASGSYVRAKERAAAAVGIETHNHILSHDIGQAELEALIRSLNENDRVNGILLQLPLPNHLDAFDALDRILPSKDADALTCLNTGKLMKGIGEVVPCTAKGILRILQGFSIPLLSANVLIINRSDIVGKPLAALLSKRGVDATVTVAHSMSADIKALAASADIIVTAAGHPGLIDRTWNLKEGVTVIDVSINRVPDSGCEKGYAVTGDFKPEDFASHQGFYTPVPGGVGLMTVCSLLENTLFLARAQMGGLA